MAEHALLGVLPEVFQVAATQSPPLEALAAVATDLHEPVVEVLDRIDEVVDPFRTPEPMVGYLASWVDLGWLTVPGRDASSRPALAGGSAPLRDLITASADLSARRGTPGGLTEFLRLATGVDGFVVEDVPGAFHVTVRAPAAAADQLDTVRRIVDTLKPAHVTAEVVPADGVETPASGDTTQTPVTPETSGAPEMPETEEPG